jgi:hypothetical protein
VSETPLELLHAMQRRDIEERVSFLHNTRKAAAL